MTQRIILTLALGWIEMGEYGEALESLKALIYEANKGRISPAEKSALFGSINRCRALARRHGQLRLAA